jgi:hypothetical protein
MKNEKSAGDVLAVMAYCSDLPEKVVMTRNYGALLHGDVLTKIQGDPLGCYANQLDTTYVLPWLVRYGLEKGMMRLHKAHDEVACA